MRRTAPPAARSGLRQHAIEKVTPIEICPEGMIKGKEERRNRTGFGIASRKQKRFEEHA